MAQTVPIDAYLGTARAGLAIGATVYQLDGSTSYASFSTAGWYEAPGTSGAWHHAGLSLPDAGGVVAVGVAGTEYMRGAVNYAPPAGTAYTDARAAKLDYLDATITSRLGTADYTAAPTAATVADTVLTRSIANVEGSADAYSLSELILSHFKSSAPGTVWTIYQTDGVTVFNVRSLTEDENAKPVTGVS